MHRALLAICLTTIVVSVASAAEGRWEALSAGTVGGAPDDGLASTLALPDGTVLIGGIIGPQVPLPGLQTINHGGSRSLGVLMRYDPELEVVLTLARFPASVTDLALAGDGDVLVLAGGLHKVSPDLADVRWVATGGRAVDGDGAGGAFVLVEKKSVTRIDANGQSVGTFRVGSGWGSTDIAVDPVSQRFFVAGSKSARGGGNPVHIAWMHGHSFDGERVWTAYDFSGPEVASVSDMADSHPQALAVHDGYLYMTGDTEGGNTVYRHLTDTLGGDLPTGTMPGNFWNGNTWKAFSSRRMLWAGKYDVSNGALVAGTFFYGMTHDSRRDKEGVGDADAHAIAVGPDGRVAITGVMRARMKWTNDALHQAYTDRTHDGRWNNNVGPDELFLAVFEPDFSGMSFLSGFSQGGLYEPRGKGHGVALGDGIAVVVGTVHSPPDLSATPDWYAMVNPMQATAGGGKDGYAAILRFASASDERLSVAERCQLIVERLGGEFSEGPWVAELQAGRVGAAVSALRAAGADELAAMCERLGQATLEQAKAGREVNPAGNLAVLSDIGQLWRGHPIADEASQLAAEWEADPAFQARLAISEQLNEIMEFAADLSAAPEGGLRSCVDPAWNRANRRVISRLQRLIPKLLEASPDSNEAERARQLVASIDLPLTRDDKRRFSSYENVVGLYGRLREVRRAKSEYGNERFYDANQRVLETIRAGSIELIEANPDDAIAGALTEWAGRFKIPLER